MSKTVLAPFTSSSFLHHAGEIIIGAAREGSFEVRCPLVIKRILTMCSPGCYTLQAFEYVAHAPLHTEFVECVILRLAMIKCMAAMAAMASKAMHARRPLHVQDRRTHIYIKQNSTHRHRDNN